MITSNKKCVFCIVVVSCFFLLSFNPSAAVAAKAGKKTLEISANAAFDANKMSDMSDFDPDNPVMPEGDTIKVAVVMSFSGPAAKNGELTFLWCQWVAHDLNKRGGIWVDGKKKKIQLIKADHMSKADQCKKVVERMALQEKVDVFFGTDGSNMMKIINQVASKYKIIVANFAALTDELMDAENFNRYSFMSTYSTGQIGRAQAYYFGQIRKKEKKFYLIGQDYSFGRSLAEGFKKGLKEYYPEAQVVGEDYHKLFQTDFAPYLAKIKASGAEVVFTGDWIPDLANLLKQARSMGIMIPFTNRIMDDATMLSELGIENSKGIVNLTQFEYTSPSFQTPQQIKFHKTWNDQWKSGKWKQRAYTSKFMAYPEGQNGANMMQLYWLFSVIERAKSTDPEKIIKVWEGDTYKTASGKILTMRACDHKVIQDLAITEFVPPNEQKASYNIPPYYWYNDCSYYGRMWIIPAEKILPIMDQKLDRCKGKSDWGK
jgi:branched-chain amino acid transport system substrate-binding protein